MPKHPLLPQAQCRAYTVTVILLLGEVILLCSCCVERGLVYVAIAAPSSRQPSSYLECTFVNMRSSYNICSVSDTKCIYTCLISL